MAPLIVLVTSTLILRGIGRLGVRRFATWKDSAQAALAIMFFFTAASHFTAMKHDLAAMVPPPLTGNLTVIYLTGVLEIAGGVGILFHRTRRLAGICLVLLLLAMFPANVRAAVQEIPLRGGAATPLWLRAPLQLFFVGMVWWTAIDRPGSRREENLRGRWEMEDAMAAYVIVDIIVTDPARFEEYKSAVPATIAAHGGRYLVRGGPIQVVEGTWQPSRVVLLEFDSAAQARQWLQSPEYQNAKRRREEAARFNMVIVEGEASG